MELKTDLIERLEGEIERQIEVVVKHFQNLGSDDLLKMTKEGGWSIAQNLEHLNLYFKYYIPAITEALKDSKMNTLNSGFSSGWLGNYFTKSMDYRKGNKIKAFKDYIPTSDLDAHAVISGFLEYQETLLQLVRQAASYDLDKIKVAISLTKWVRLKLGDVFQFVIMHNERHIKQAEHALNS